MGLFSNIFTKQPASPAPQNIEQNTEQRSFFSDALSFNTLSSYTTSTSMRLSAVYSAVNAISNAVATLPLNIYQIDSNGYKLQNNNHQYNYLLNVQPSNNLSKFNFFKLIISSVMLKGNGYAHIKRNASGIITEIKYIQPETVTINYNQINDKITYYVTGYKQPIESKDMLHFWMFSNDTINGLSVINYAVNTLKLATDSETHSANFFKSGAASNGILKANSSLTDPQKQQIRTAWQNAFSDGSGNGVAIVPMGMDYQPISINSKDAQLLESRQFSVVEIARFFNISPVKLFDLTHASYSSLEQTQLSFLQDTINPYLIMIEQEINRKLFNTTEQKINTINFDVTAMLSTDKQATAEYYKTMLVNGIMTINEVRKALNLNDVENGNDLYMQLNMSTVKNLINQTPAPNQQKIKQKTKQQLVENK